MSIINFSNTRQMEGLFDAINPIKELIESKINLSRTADREKRINLNQNKVMRICFIVGLSLPTKRSIDDYKDRFFVKFGGTSSIVNKESWLSVVCFLPYCTSAFLPL